MAKTTISQKVKKTSTKRPGVVAKTRNSKIKSSKNYVKRYRGQGK